MRKLVCLVLLAACELKPAPKQQPPAATPPAPAQPVAPTPPVVEGAGSAAPGAAAPKVEISGPCKDVGAKIATVYVESATDPSQKRVLEQERANITRKAGEACTLQAWSDDARTCYLATKTPADIKACETKFSPPPAPQPPAPTEG